MLEGLSGSKDLAQDVQLHEKRDEEAYHECCDACHLETFHDGGRNVRVDTTIGVVLRVP